jgi:hypothetical protein
MVVLRLGYVHLLIIIITGEDGAHAEVAGAVLAELLPDELLVDEGGALELRQHQPRHEQQLHRVPDGDPVQDRLGHHLQQRDEGVDDPVRQPLLVVHLGRALHGAHRRVQRVQQGDAWPAKNGTANAHARIRYMAFAGRQEYQKSTEKKRPEQRGGRYPAMVWRWVMSVHDLPISPPALLQPKRALDRKLTKSTSRLSELDDGSGGGEAKAYSIR